MSNFVVFLALSASLGLATPGTITAFEATYPGGLAAIKEVGEGEKGSVIYEVAGARVLVGYSPKAVPSTITTHALTSIESWSEGHSALQHQSGHVTIGLVKAPRGYKAALKGATAVTLVAGALASNLPVSAAIFADSALVVDPADLRTSALEFARNGEPPVHLWVSRNPLMLEDEQGKTKPMVITRGLKPFVGREIEFASNKYPLQLIASRVSDASSYLIKRGPILKDGETFGISETERIRVKHLSPGLSGVPALSFTVEVPDPSEIPN